MAEDSGGEKSLPASAQKKQRQRERGNVARSTDLSAAVTLLAALLAFYMLGPSMFAAMLEATRYYFEHASQLLATESTIQTMARDASIFIVRGSLPFMTMLLIAGVAANIIQFGLLFSAQTLEPKVERLNPIAGMRKFFTLRSLIELIKAVLKLAIVGYVVYLTLRGRWDEVLLFSYLTPPAIAAASAKLIALVWLRVGIALLVLGLLDFAYQRWQWEQDLRMTRQEAQDELRQYEGDPRIRQRIRQIQRQMAMQRMMAEVPAADVVITNPTTYAVALRYDADEMQAPIVVAKGARLVADRIRTVAAENDVPLVEKPELAREIYRKIEIGHPVPDTLFRAVAEILAFVYRVDRRIERQRQRELALNG